MATHLKGKVQTVLGIKDPQELGVILPHEHLMLNFQDAAIKPEYGPDNLTELSYEMKNLGKIRQFPYSVKANLVLKQDDVTDDLKLFKKAGGGCVCDLTSIGLRMNTQDLPQVSRDSGVDIVVGTSYYVDPFIPEEAKMMSVEEMAEVHISEIELGVGRSGVKCGVIGEVGCSSPLTENEIKSLRAAALAQQKTGAPLIIHPGREERAPFEILDILEAAGADLSHTAMSHLDRTIFHDSVLLEFAKRGCYLELDLFGMECSHYQWMPTVDMPSDAQRIKAVKLLVDNGYAHRVLLSHDIHTKHRLVNYGGHGYRHILEHIVPKMADRGIKREVIQQMITQNPQQWLAFR